MAILVDSSVWIDFFNGRRTPQTNYLYRHLGEKEFITGDLILAEVLQGFQTEHDCKTARKGLLSFDVYHLVGKEIAIRSAENYRRLRAKGHTILKTIDCLIATFCLTNDFELLHSDSGFTPFEKVLKLKVIHP